MNFTSLASLFLPASGEGALVEASSRWSPYPEETAAVVWGRAPTWRPASRTAQLRSALARERALLRARVRPPDAFSRAEVHRWPLPRIRPRAARERLRSVLLDGAVVELWSGRRHMRVLDSCLQAAGASPTGRLRLASGNLVLVVVRTREGAPAIARIARRGEVTDPHEGSEALRRLEAASVARVPRLVGSGIEMEAAWSVETLLPGRRPERLAPAIALEVAAMCASLPRSGTAPTAFREDLDRIRARFPHLASDLQAAEDAVAIAVRDVPGVLRHGDLWSGNLLAAGDRLTGVVDWDSWHPAGVPGADLLHLFATDVAVRTGRGIGETWRGRPWRSDGFARLSAPYWAALGIRPISELLDAVGVAWWASRVPDVISAFPDEGVDHSWVEQNVARVVQELR